MATTKIRKSVPLEHVDLTRIAAFSTDEALRNIAARHAGIGAEAISSEAVLMLILVRAGLDALERELDEKRYAQLAAAEDDEDRRFRAAVRTRRAG